jgi:hypothetical protein
LIFRDEWLLDYRRIEEPANKKGISLRTDCFCNPGAGEADAYRFMNFAAGFRDKVDMKI